MGNQVDRLTHLSYDEVPTTDPAGLDHTDASQQVGVSYVFSEEEDEDGPEDGRVSPPPPPLADDPDDEIEFRAYFQERCIFSKRCLRALPPDVLSARCRPGDLVEFVRPQRYPHWAVVLGPDGLVHLREREVRRDSWTAVAAGRRGRVVSDWYRFEALPPELVARSARQHVGSRGQHLSWRSSEAFAAWCRFARREFKAGGEIRVGKQPYRLTARLGDTALCLSFQSLEDLMAERRKRDEQGRHALLEELLGDGEFGPADDNGRANGEGAGDGPSGVINW
uniref:LRAT domain containing 2 n=1 Tax=Eptatretus burgeri TaxID=7764 RepID=A0A8C4Q5S4_EPTBU